MIYDFEWPKNAADFERLYSLKNFDLKEIHTDINVVDGKRYTIGIKFTFHGETDPITFGRFDGTKENKAVFKSSEQISTTKCSGEHKVDESKCRNITFLGKDG